MKPATLAVFLTALVCASTACADDHVIVGFWNIEKLGDRGQHPKALVEHIRLAGADILGLCEIKVDATEDGERKNDKLDETTKILNELPRTTAATR